MCRTYRNMVRCHASFVADQRDRAAQQRLVVILDIEQHVSVDHADELRPDDLKL